MTKIQCDENLIKILNRLLSFLKTDVQTEIFSKKFADIAIVRTAADAERVNAGILLVNSDDKNLTAALSGKNRKIITCGFSSRSTVTLSSVSEKCFVVCLQRSVKSISGKTLSPLEIPVELCGLEFDEISILMMITAALLCDIPASLLNKIQL